MAISNVLVVSIRQAVTPDRLLGRMNASIEPGLRRDPFGALAGGVLGEPIGLRETLAVAAIGLLLAPSGSSDRRSRGCAAPSDLMTRSSR